jgi:hypothetical protein
MILSNTLASSVILNGQTSTVNTPADTLAPLGFGVVSNGENWQGRPGPNLVVNALGAPAASATVTLDWSQYSYFTVTATNAFTLAFANAQVGEMILIQITTGAGATTWPTISWFSTANATGVKPTTTSLSVVVAVVCTAPGTYSAFTVSV